MLQEEVLNLSEIDFSNNKNEFQLFENYKKDKNYHN